MAKNHMPVAYFGVRPDDVRADFLPREALEKWHQQARAVSTSSDAFVIDVLGVIGETWDDTGVTASKVSALLRMAGDRPVIANIDSPGGDFFEGLSIYNLFRLHKSDVTTRVLGIAASAASIIAMGGDRVEIAKSAFFMIHNTRTAVYADAPRMENVAVQLRAFDAELAELYAARSGMEAAKLSAMMNEGDKYISGRDAVNQNFADDFVPADQIALVRNDADHSGRIKARTQFAMIVRSAGLTRSEGIDLHNRLTAKPSAGDDGMPGAAESLAALMGSVTSFLGK